ncbi:ABC transporter ATP-binding protein [Flavihumibacter solisilvae]|uniref:Multidrug ABC transporter ATPase n=1 Tax=Flavihumibacter solisilvae TaxID=1349421 RepID=A0A0C1INF3_9BACT|nr:ABC transporter ATP-binding protein [Flavihumibacter solisilvae]KIC95775.1 multidrug ABC transporter ATPase [Flavihumibacter solisilvae]
MHTLTISNLTKMYPNGVKALDNISIEISNGMFGLLGPNGAGKSTLMKTIAGLQPASSGEIFFNGQDILSDPLLIKRHLGYLPQEFGVYPKLTAYQLLDHLAVLKGVHRSERQDQIHALLQQVNLYAERNREVHRFSGGMRQRFGIAQALLGSPRIIIVDEPTAGLDPEERNRFNNLLSEIGEQVIVLLSTHIVDDVKSLCSRMAIINKGRILAEGSPATFLDSMEGTIWKKSIDKLDLPHYSKNHQVLSTQLNAGRLQIHIHSVNAPGNGFEPVVPGLEDVYFFQLIKENAA